MVMQTEIDETMWAWLSHMYRRCHSALTHQAYCQSIIERADVRACARREEDQARVTVEWERVGSREHQQHNIKMVRKSVFLGNFAHTYIFFLI